MSRERWPVKDRWLIPGLVMLALLPRLIGLQAFVTNAEINWTRHVVEFWQALLVGDWSGTVVSAEPGVGVALGGGVGLAIYALLQPGLSLPDLLLAIPSSRVVLFFLAVMRLPLIVLICLGIGLIYRFLRPTLGQWPALLAALLVAYDPSWVAYSRLLRPEGLSSILLLLALILLMHIVKSGRNALVGAGILSGLAWANSWTGVILGPFAVALFFSMAATKRSLTAGQRLWRGLEPLLFWLMLALLTWVVVWPAAWIEPWSLPRFILQAAESNYASPVARQFPLDQGFLHYPAHFIFYTTPIVMIGLVLWGIFRRHLATETRYLTQMLLGFALIFLLFQTFFVRKDAGAILPVFGATAIVAATGWCSWAARLQGLSRRLVIGGAVVGQLLCVLPFTPYYLTYLNPLVGGPWLAANVIEIGQGEGMDQVGAWLNAQPDAVGNVVGSEAGVTLEPYFAGLISDVTAPDLAYVVLYHSMVQRELPSPTILRYYQQLMEPAHLIRLDGIDYAALYQGPAVQQTLSLPIGMQTNILPRPLAFRSSANSVRRGGSITVDVIWLTSPTQPAASSILSLREPVDLAAYEADVAALDLDDAEIEANPNLLPPLTRQVFAEAEAPLLTVSAGLTVSRHTLLVPSDMLPGQYSLVADGRPLGHITVVE